MIPKTAWESWQRRSVGQFRLVHYVQPGGRALMEEHLPAVLGEMGAVGALRFNPAEAQARQLADGAGKDLDLSRFETLTTCRRPLIEFAYAAAARKTPGVEVRYGCPAAGLVTGTEVIPGVPHITGVRTESGETIERQGRGGRGWPPLTAVRHDRGRRRAPAAGARLRGGFRLQHAVLPGGGAAGAARRPAVRHRSDLGPDASGRQRLVVGDAVSLPEGQA